MPILNLDLKLESPVITLTSNIPSVLLSTHSMSWFRFLLRESESMVTNRKPLKLLNSLHIGSVKASNVSCKILTTGLSSEAEACHRLVVKARIEFRNVKRVLIKYTPHNNGDTHNEKAICAGSVKIHSSVIHEREKVEQKHELEAIFTPAPDDLSNSTTVLFDNGFNYLEKQCTVCFYNAWFFDDSGAGKTQLVKALTILDGPNGCNQLYNLKSPKGEIIPAPPEQGEF
ncbi:hypothetical protein HK098_008158 [Nowakowskiella sp. JEL0407]|nr:hypothetical protein HK098_008158 [Nowakowskiella sp. JEL0407]